MQDQALLIYRSLHFGMWYEYLHSFTYTDVYFTVELASITAVNITESIEPLVIMEAYHFVAQTQSSLLYILLLCG